MKRLLMLLGLAASSALTAAPVSETKDYSYSQSNMGAGEKWPMYLQLEGKKGNFRNIARLSWLVPLWQDDDSMLFGDVRLMMDDKSDREANIGLGYRHIVRDWDMASDGVVLGAYAFYDRRKSTLGNKYNQATLGVEALGDYFRFSANYYAPQNKKHHISSTNVPNFVRSGWNVVNNELVFTYNTIVNRQTQEELTLKGYDVELRGKAPIADDINIWGGIGAYRFSREGVKRDGPMAMLDLEMLNALGVNGSRASIGFEYRKDKGFKANRYGVLKLTTPLAEVGKGKSYPSLTGVEYEMTRFVLRDVDIQTGISSKTNRSDVMSSGNTGLNTQNVNGETTLVHHVSTGGSKAYIIDSSDDGTKLGNAIVYAIVNNGCYVFYGTNDLSNLSYTFNQDKLNRAAEVLSSYADIDRMKRDMIVAQMREGYFNAGGLIGIGAGEVGYKWADQHLVSMDPVALQAVAIDLGIDASSLQAQHAATRGIVVTHDYGLDNLVFDDVTLMFPETGRGEFWTRGLDFGFNLTPNSEGYMHPAIINYSDERLMLGYDDASSSSLQSNQEEGGTGPGAGAGFTAGAIRVAIAAAAKVIAVAGDSSTAVINPAPGAKTVSNPVNVDVGNNDASNLSVIKLNDVDNVDQLVNALENVNVTSSSSDKAPSKVVAKVSNLSDTLLQAIKERSPELDGANFDFAERSDLDRYKDADIVAPGVKVSIQGSKVDVTSPLPYHEQFLNNSLKSTGVSVPGYGTHNSMLGLAGYVNKYRGIKGSELENAAELKSVVDSHVGKASELDRKGQIPSSDMQALLGQIADSATQIKYSDTVFNILKAGDAAQMASVFDESNWKTLPLNTQREILQMLTALTVAMEGSQKINDLINLGAYPSNPETYDSSYIQMAKPCFAAAIDADELEEAVGNVLIPYVTYGDRTTVAYRNAMGLVDSQIPFSSDQNSLFQRLSRIESQTASDDDQSEVANAIKDVYGTVDIGSAFQNMQMPYGLNAFQALINDPAQSSEFQKGHNQAVSLLFGTDLTGASQPTKDAVRESLSIVWTKNK